MNKIVVTTHKKLVLDGVQEPSRASVSQNRGVATIEKENVLETTWTSFLEKLATATKGGKGSGHKGHSGRPGKRGGSLPGKGISIISSNKKDIAGSKELAKYSNPITHQCWRNSVMAMPMTEEGTKYVEGQFLIEFDGRFSFPIEHGWLEKPDGTILDVTLPDDVGTYIKAREYTWDEIWDYVDEGEGTLPITNYNDENWIEASKVAFDMAGLSTITKGGKGSGHKGHSGRPGKVGGSLPGTRSNMSFEEAKGMFLDKMMGHYAYHKGLNRGDPWLIHSVYQYMRDAKERNYRDYEDQTALYAGFVYRDMEGNILRDDNGNIIENPYEYFGNAEVDKYMSGYEGVYLTREDFDRIFVEVEAIRENRLNDVRKMLGGVPSYNEIFGDLDITSPQLDRREFREKVAEGLAPYTRNIVEHALEINDGELYPALMSDIENAVAERYGRHTDEGKEAISNIYNTSYELRNAHEFEVMHQVALGNIEPEGAPRLGHHTIDNPQGSKWEPLPETLWHVTTNSQGILENGIKSRRELGQHMGLGLGGGQDETISFTADLETAKGIERTLHEAHLVASGELTTEGLLRNAMSGGRGVGKNWLGTLISKSEFATYMPKDDFEAVKVPGFDPFSDEGFLKLPAGLKHLILAEKGLLEKPESDKWIKEHRWDFYRWYLRSAQWEGGYSDPLFFGTDYEGLARLNPQNFSIMQYKPKPRSMGYKMGSLGEWRTVGGDVVELTKVIDYIKSGDIDEILGIIKKAMEKLELWAKS